MNLQVLNEVVSEDLEGDEEWGEVILLLILGGNLLIICV